MKVCEFFNIIKSYTILNDKKELKCIYKRFHVEILEYFKKNGYIENYEIIGIEPKKQIKISFFLKKINVIKGFSPFIYVKNKDLYTYYRYINKSEGVLLFSTHKYGLVDQKTIIKEKIGGVLIGYII